MNIAKGLGIGCAIALGVGTLGTTAYNSVKRFNQTQATIAEIRKISQTKANQVDAFVSRHSTTHQQALDSAQKALKSLR